MSETFEQAAQRILSEPAVFPEGHILNESITPVGNLACAVMLCGVIQAQCSDGRFRPEIEIYCLNEVGRDRETRPFCERCMEIAGL